MPNQPNSGEAYPDWQDAALGGNLLSYAWNHAPTLDQLVPPESVPSFAGEPAWMRTADQVMRVPGQVVGNALLGPFRAAGGAFDRWMSGDQGPSALRDITGATLGLGALGMGAGAPEGSLGVFAGPRAAEADMAALGRAAKGEPWGPGGWFQDVDGRWKFEIPDKGAKLNPEFTSPNGNLYLGHDGSVDLQEFLDHPDLYANYPHLQNVQVKALSPQDMVQYPGLKGAVSEQGNIYLRPGETTSDTISTLLHEIQHKIQHEEGFAVGGNPKEFLAPDFQDRVNQTHRALSTYKNYFQTLGINPDDLYETLEARMAGHPLTPAQSGLLAAAKSWGLHDLTLKDFINHNRNWTDLKIENQNAFDKYQSLAGEVEARNVQERLGQDAYGVHPHATTGYPAVPQIVRGASAETSPYALVPVNHDPFATE